MDSSLLLITSFNLFAFAGNGLADDEITDELGVVISSPDIAKRILLEESFKKKSALL